MRQITLALLVIVLLTSCNKEEKMCKCGPEELYPGYTKDLELANKIIGKKWKLQNQEVYIELSSNIDEELSKKDKGIRGKCIYTSGNPEIIDEKNYYVKKFKESDDEEYYKAQEEGKVLGTFTYNVLYTNASLIIELTETTLVLQDPTEFLKGTNNGKEYWEVVK